LRRVEVLTLEDATVCGWCCNDFGPGMLALRWHGIEFCTHDCLESYAELNTHGRDFIAAQDQALAEAEAALATRPNEFVLLYNAPEEEQIKSVLLAPPEFLAACVHALVLMVGLEGEVEPPN
jgi:hypothetical protein